MPLDDGKGIDPNIFGFGFTKHVIKFLISSFGGAIIGSLFSSGSRLKNSFGEVVFR